MRTSSTNMAEAPSDDKRWRLVDATMRRHGNKSDALIETLHTVQEAFGYLDDISLRYVASNLKVPLSQVYGVATFYHFFTLKPPALHACVVCLGTACHIKGGRNILSAIEKLTGIKPGETTSDGKVSLSVARCLGMSGLAPAVVFDDECVGNISPSVAVEKIRKWK